MKAKRGLFNLIGTKQNKKITFIFILSLRDQEYYHFLAIINQENWWLIVYIQANIYRLIRHLASARE